MRHGAQMEGEEVMGEIAKAAAAAAPEKRGFRDVLEANWGRIASVMPKHASPERLFQIALSAYNTTPHLKECSPGSVLSCVMKCAALGMEPSAVDGLGRAYILPYKNGKTGRYEAQLILGYKGMIDLARRSGQLVDISARVVREGDEFEYAFGLEERLRHVPSTEPPAGRQVTHVYMVAHFRDGGHYFEVMSREEVEAVRRRSKSPDKGPWATDWEAMAKKTVVRRAFPFMPVSVEAQEASAQDGSTPRFVDADGVLFGLPAPDPDEPAEPDAVEVPEGGGEGDGDRQG